jgi:hypothetical protein
LRATAASMMARSVWLGTSAPLRSSTAAPAGRSARSPSREERGWAASGEDPRTRGRRWAAEARAGTTGAVRRAGACQRRSPLLVLGVTGCEPLLEGGALVRVPVCNQDHWVSHHHLPVARWSGPYQPAMVRPLPASARRRSALLLRPGKLQHLRKFSQPRWNTAQTKAVVPVYMGAHEVGH